MTDVDCKCKLGQEIELSELGISHYCPPGSERSFAEVVGCIENVIISEKFLEIQSKFLEEHYMEFEEEEENRLVYMDIFKDYLSTVEKYIEERLMENIPGFDIRTFESELERKPHELNEEIYDMLSTFWNFDTFKQMFLEYKKMKQGHSVDFSEDIRVSKYKIYKNEKEDLLRNS